MAAVRARRAGAHDPFVDLFPETGRQTDARATTPI